MLMFSGKRWFVLRPGTVDDLNAGLALFERNERLGTFDAVLAACATQVGASAFVSADAGFATIPEITYVSPDHEGVSALLAS